MSALIELAAEFVLGIVEMLAEGGKRLRGRDRRPRVWIPPAAKRDRGEGSTSHPNQKRRVRPRKEDFDV
jgi:hypothetical protein